MNRRQRVVILTGCLVLLLLGLFPPYKGDISYGPNTMPSVFIGYHSILWAPTYHGHRIDLESVDPRDVEFFRDNRVIAAVDIRINMDRFWIGFVVCIAVTLGLVVVLSSSKPDD